jgi:hypothetical protein
MFDYSNGPGSIEVKLLPAPSTPCPQADLAMQEDHASRVGRSAGRLDLHLVQFRDGATVQAIMFRWRSADARIYDGLVELARSLSDDPKEREAQLSSPTARNLVNMQVISIH